MNHLLTITAIFFLVSCKGQTTNVIPSVYEVDSNDVRLVESDSLPFILNGDSLFYDGHFIQGYKVREEPTIYTSDGTLELGDTYFFDDNGKNILSKDTLGHYTFYVPMDSVVNYLLKREDNAWEQYNELFLKCTGRKP